MYVRAGRPAFARPCVGILELTKKRSRRYPATTITDADYADDIAILANTHDQAETLLHSLERAAKRKAKFLTSTISCSNSVAFLIIRQKSY